MTKCSLKRTLPCLVGVLLSATLAAVPAAAQYRPVPAPGTASVSQKGETYHVEFAVNLWNPTPDIVASSDGVAIQGTPIDARGTLGIQKKRVYDFRLVLRPSKRHKFRFAYLPLNYKSTATLDTIVYFNGREYPVTATVDSDLQWKTFRVGYEYDFVSNTTGFFGVVLEAKVTQTQIQLTSVAGNEFAKAHAPIPAIGGIGRVYVAPGFSMTAEYLYFRLPSSLIKDTKGHYHEFDIYATYNVTNAVGAQIGYRKMDVAVTVTNVDGAAKLSGLYLGGVVRF